MSHFKAGKAMSAALGDNSKEILFSQNITYVAVVVIAVLYLWSMKKFFGTFFMRTAFGNYQKNKVIQKKYHEMFASRDNLMYHISWAKTRGEMDEARNLMKQLEAIDEGIDRIEQENSQLFGYRKPRPAGEKLA